MKNPAVVLALLFALAAPATAEDPCPCVPIAKIWIAKECDSWSCAVAELVKAEGDPLVFTLPTTGSQYRWVILRRVNSGSGAVSPNSPFAVETFDSSMQAAVQHAVMDPARIPMLVTTVDGKSLLVGLRQPDPEIARRRAVRR